MIYTHKCQLERCGIIFQSRQQFRVGCCKAHGLEVNKLTVKHGKRPEKQLTVGRRMSKKGYAGAGPENVVTIRVKHVGARCNG